MVVETAVLDGAVVVDTVVVDGMTVVVGSATVVAASEVDVVGNDDVDGVVVVVVVDEVVVVVDEVVVSWSSLTRSWSTRCPGVMCSAGQTSSGAGVVGSVLASDGSAGTRPARPTSVIATSSRPVGRAEESSPPNMGTGG